VCCRNRDNRFIGWSDSHLTKEGLEEARAAGRALALHGVVVDEVHSSVLQRCIRTAQVVLEEMGQSHVPITTHWRLNERFYGSLTGRNKKECVMQYGVQRVKEWRRSYDVPPPAMEPDHPYRVILDPTKYGMMGQGEVPLTESLCDTRRRASQYWEEVLVPRIRSGRRLLICGHENNLRSLLMHIDGISKEAIVDLEIPRAVPLLYRFDRQMRPIRVAGAAPYLSSRYLIAQETLAAIQERDFKQVYDTSIQRNLEELALEEATALIAASQAPQAQASARPRTTVRELVRGLIRSSNAQRATPRPVAATAQASSQAFEAEASSEEKEDAAPVLGALLPSRE
jgi:2,3-bisphosphoglycerate-dependent phosphoglycerate mutase